LFSGNQNARNMPAAVQAAARLCLTATPRRGITSRLISNQHASAIASVGNRIQMLVVEMCAHSASRS
jgi:sulfur relay (sulfurtransferase) complex TusBCD TusD component (DsrE family)